MNDEARVRFWQTATLWGPAAALILPGLLVSLVGGFRDFELVGRTLSAAQAFAVIGTMFFPFAAHFFAEQKANEAMSRLSQSWPTAPARIDRSEVHDRRTNIGRLWRLEVHYTYDWAGERRTGQRLAFAPYWFSNWAVVDGLAKKYPAGAAVTVRVDPLDPDCAVLETAEALAGQRQTRLLIFALGPFGFALMALLVGGGVI